MKTSKKNFCFIPAKACSTRLKNKNILPLNGKEMIYYSIRNAKESQLFSQEDVIVSSESQEVLNIAQKYSASTPYTRPEFLAKDPYGVVDVLWDFLERFPDYKNYDACCILLVTSPLTLPEDILGAYKQFITNSFNTVISVTPIGHSVFRSVYVNDGLVEPLYPEHILKKSQELPQTYRINGSVTWINIKEYLKYKSFFLQPWGSYIMPQERSIDIDYEFDYNYAEYLLKRTKENYDN